jgi:DNA-binding NtrC family response regulator
MPVRQLTEEALAKLTAYSWKGNVRELENTMHRSVLLATGTNIDADAVYLSGATDEITAATPSQQATSTKQQNTTTSPTQNNPLVGRSVDSVEQELIIDTLSYCLGNRTHAANILGISIRTLRNKLKTYSEQGLNVPPAVGEE